MIIPLRHPPLTRSHTSVHIDLRVCPPVVEGEGVERRKEESH